MIFIHHHSPVVIDELQEVLGIPYDIAIKVILKYEIDLHTIAWYGLTELRDVTTHIASAMNADDETEALMEIRYAREHIRRAALETLHEYASDMYFELEPRLNGLTTKYKLLMLPPPDLKRVQELKDKIQKCLLEARMSRGTDWIKPVVTSWQFGLGRVVSLSTDNGKFWSSELYSGENARLMPSIINWVVGDPQLDKGLVVYSSDMYLGSPGTITVLSDTLPGVSFGGQEVSMSKTEDRSFEGVLDPVSQGVFGLVVTAGGERIDDLLAVDYPLEYRDVGNNPEFLEAVKRNRGGVYYPEQAASLLFSDIMTYSVRTTVEHVDLRWVVLLVVLVVFLSEVVVRRVHGIIGIKDRRKGV